MFNSLEEQSKTEDQKKMEAMDTLLQIAKVLESLGLNVTYRLLKPEFLTDLASPIVSDGADAIRAEYNKRQGLMITFTNGFEEPEDPKRQEIIKKLQEAGFGKYLRGFGINLNP